MNQPLRARTGRQHITRPQASGFVGGGNTLPYGLRAAWLFNEGAGSRIFNHVGARQLLIFGSGGNPATDRVANDATKYGPLSGVTFVNGLTRLEPPSLADLTIFRSAAVTGGTDDDVSAVCLWKPTGTLTNKTLLGLGQDGSGAGCGISLYTDGTPKGLFSIVRNVPGAAQVDATGTTTLVADTLYMLGGRWKSGKEAAFFLDGRKEATGTDTGSQIRMGSDGAGLGWFWGLAKNGGNQGNGTAYLAYIWARALNDVEFALLAQYPWLPLGVSAPLMGEGEVLKTVNRDAIINVDWRTSIQRDAVIPVDWDGQKILNRDALIREDWTGFINRDAIVNEDWTGFINRDAVINEDWDGEPAFSLPDDVTILTGVFNPLSEFVDILSPPEFADLKEDATVTDGVEGLWDSVDIVSGALKTAFSQDVQMPAIQVDLE